MEILGAIVGPILTKISEYAIDKVFNGSLARYNDNITGLRDQVAKLVAAKADLQNRIKEAEVKAEDVFENVRDWMTNVDAKTHEANTFLTEIEEDEMKKCSSFNLNRRRRLSKKAKNMGTELSLIQQLGQFDQVACSAPLSAPIINVEDYLSFESRETIMKDILESLQDPDIKMIGVHGMGGIGKTELVKRISNQVSQSKSFEPVILLTVGQSSDVKLVQQELVEMLRLPSDITTLQGRAALLQKRLHTAEKNKILIIFDDIWDFLDLETVGIPSGDGNKGCKILVTSRSKQVLTRKMGIKKIFEVKGLNEQESWQLFKIAVDDKSIDQNDREKMPIATEIVNKCGNLPLAIVIVGKALKGEPLYTWRDALRQLKDPANVEIEGVSKQVYTSLKWSYDRIKSPEAKSLFLLCSIFPDDHEIEIDELSTYAIGSNIIQGVNTLRTARDKILTMVDHLESSSLLQKCKSKWTGQLAVKMHDVVRDVAIYIASTDDQMCTLSYGKGLNKWQGEKLCGDYTAIRVDCVGFEDLPLDLSFSKLELLALIDNGHKENRILQIPEGYLERMGKLKVLHLEGMRFTLPSSFDCLVNLQTLLLIDCRLENIDMIGKLKSLEILDFSKSNITELPLSLSQLTGLKHLKVSECRKLEVIQPEVISRMTKLEELFLDNTFNDWELGESNNCEQKKSKARISELGCLPCLTCLYLCIPDIRSLPELVFLNNLELERFHIVIGKTRWNDLGEKMLDIETDSRNDVFKELRLLEKCENLCLKGRCGVKNVVSKLKTSANLTFLKLDDNEDVEYLVSDLNHDAFSILETLVLIRMMGLETIINEGYSFKTFEKLKTLTILGCDRMKYLFPVSIIEGLSNLEIIKIQSCKKMEAIMVVTENEEAVDKIQFTRLKQLQLKKVPELKSFCGKLVKANSQSSENYITPFHSQITFPNLEVVSIWVENVWHDLLIGNNTKELYLNSCKDIESVNSCKEIESVNGCKDIESVFTVKNNPTSEDVFRWVPKLESLTLWNLRNLKHVWNKDIPYEILITFQSLRYVYLENCPQIKTLFPPSLTKHLQQLQKIFIKHCGIHEIFGMEDSDYSNSKVSFPSLYSLKIENVNNLEIIWHNRLIVDDMSNLQSLKFDNCKSLKCIFTSNVMSALKRLDKLHIQNCDSLEQVFEIHQMIEPKEHCEVASINLRKLVLCNLPNLKHVWSNDPFDEMYQFQDLKDVEVTNCPNLVTLFPPSRARDLLLKLERLHVDVTFMKQEPSRVELNSVMDASIGLKEMKLVGDENVIRELCRLNLSSDLFPGVKVLRVEDLHNYERVEVDEASLIEIFSDKEHRGISSKMIQQLFDNLEVVEVENCSRLETLMISSSFSFQNLKQLTIYKCHGLKNLFGLTVAKTLVCLKKVELCECNNVSRVLTKRKDEREEDEIVFSELEVLELYDLPNLEMFQGAEDWTIRFPKLKTIAIENCPKMMTFSHGIVCTPLLKFIIAEKMYPWIDEPKKLWASNINDTIRQLYDEELENIPTMVAGVRSDDSNAQLEATTQLRKLLSIEHSPPIEEVIETGVVPRFVEFLMREDFPELQFEAAWALTIIASGTSENTKVVIDHGAVPIFVKLLGSPSDDVREQAVCALGNVAGDSPECRDFVLGHGALQPLLAQLNENVKLSMLRNATWTLSNFCRGKPQPHFDQVKPALPVLTRLIHSNDEEVLTEACEALSYLSDGTNDKIQSVIEAGVGPRLVELLLHQSPSVLIPALRTVGNIVTGDDMQTQVMINYNTLPCLLNLLTQSHTKIIKKEACWTISIITAGNEGHIQAVIEANIIAPLAHLLQNAEFDIKKYAAWAISNATSGGSHDQLKYLVSEGCIKPLCDLLICPDPTIVTVCLKGLENILKVGEAEKNLGTTGGVNLYAQMIDDAEGLKKIENLQSHDNTEIYEKAVKILETYWLEERRRDYAL